MFSVPTMDMCAKRFYSKEEEQAFIVQLYFDGNEYYKTTIDYDFYEDSYTVYYYDVNPKREVEKMTVSEVIVKNDIGNFSIAFTNVLGFKIENPNPNIISDMTVKSVEIDWVSRTAKISVVTR